MAITQSQPALKLLTYEDYLAEGRVAGRYDVVEGERLIMPGPSWDHQTIVGNLYVALRHFGQTSGQGKAMLSPFDVLIRRIPRLQVRQPDVFFISAVRVQLAERSVRAGFLETAPELIVEVVSDSETEIRLADKLRDYHSIGVSECWIVRSETRSIELRLRGDVEYRIEAAYNSDEILVSRVFPELAVPVDTIFAE